MRFFFRLPAPLALVLTCSALPASAQTTAAPAQLRITVVDQSGAAITMASVHIAGDHVSASAQAVDGRGQTAFDSLPVGPVQVHVESPGFANFDGTLT